MHKNGEACTNNFEKEFLLKLKSKLPTCILCELFQYTRMPVRNGQYKHDEMKWIKLK